MSAMPLIVVDGKWCLQVSLCNDRFSSQTWNKDLQAGFFSGCVARPARGSKYCAEHSRTSSSKSEETSTQCIVGHRERAANGALRVEFKLADGAWVPSSAVSAGDVRRYELEKLPRCKPVLETCSQDPLRGTPEPLVSRKSGGVLVAVGPCLRILGIEPMFSSESLTQVVFFVWSMLAALRRLEWVIYDFACGVTEFLANQCRIRPDLAAKHNWQKLMGLRWVLDKLHFHGHKCRQEGSPSYNPNVNPYATWLKHRGAFVIGGAPRVRPAWIERVFAIDISARPSRSWRASTRKLQSKSSALRADGSPT